jgi:hypothetical protein
VFSNRKHQARKHPNVESRVIKIIRQDSEQQIISSSINNHHHPNDDDDEDDSNIITKTNINLIEQQERKDKIKTIKKIDANFIQPHPSTLPILSNFAPVRVFQCSSCHQQGTYKWVVERHIRAKHPDQPDAHVIELPAELAVKLQKITPPLKRFRCSLCPLQSKHTWVIIRVCILKSTNCRIRIVFLFSILSIFIHYKQRRFLIYNQMVHR